MAIKKTSFSPSEEYKNSSTVISQRYFIYIVYKFRLISNSNEIDCEDKHIFVYE